jgi:hypothetical protein
MLLIQVMHDSVLYTTYLHWKVLPEKLIVAYLEIPHLLYNPKPDIFYAWRQYANKEQVKSANCLKTV